jgi:hypothetical protein
MLGLVLAGLLLIGSGFSGGSLSTQVRATGVNIEVTWDNGNFLKTRDSFYADDGHIAAVRVWGGNACWITINDRVADAREDAGAVTCTWSREQT